MEQMPPGRPCLHGSLLLLPWRLPGLSPGWVEGCGHIPARHRSEQIPCLMPAGPGHVCTRCSKRQPRPPCPCNMLLQTLLPSCPPPPRLCGSLAPSLPLTLLQPPPGLAAPRVPQAGETGKVPKTTSLAQRHAAQPWRLPPVPPGWTSPAVALACRLCQALSRGAGDGFHLLPRTRVPTHPSLHLPPASFSVSGEGQPGCWPPARGLRRALGRGAAIPGAAGSLEERLSPAPPPRGERAQSPRGIGGQPPPSPPTAADPVWVEGEAPRPGRPLRVLRADEA